MGIIACKFGGTSTAKAKMFKKIVEILSGNPDRRYVVLSAPGRDGGGEKMTDVLYRAWHKKDASEAIRRFEGIARELRVDLDIRGTIGTALCESEAATVSRGEYLCARIFSAYCKIPFVDAADVFFFDLNGQIDMEKTLPALREMARRFERAVIPGFYGSDPGGRIMTFPRNGSDITGALVAAGVGAQLYENWTDVPGLMTGDPAIDPDASVIPSISYAGMRSMSALGAQVLHRDCLDVLERARIPTRIKCTMHPVAPGTLIHI